MPLRAVVYTSEVVEGVTEEKTARLAADAERFNRLAGVTGVLLFDGDRFLQYFEGPKDGVEAVYSRVQASRSHKALLELANGGIFRRLFPYWAMHLISIATMDVSQLAAASWAHFDAMDPENQPPSSGIFRLDALVKQHHSSPNDRLIL